MSVFSKSECRVKSLFFSLSFTWLVSFRGCTYFTKEFTAAFQSRVTPFSNTLEKTQLTIKPPPTSPPMYFTSSVICPSLAYLMSPPGKNKTMLQMMDMSANGYRVTAMQREHFPVHMLSEWGFTSCCKTCPLVSSNPLSVVRERFQLKLTQTGKWLNMVSDVRVWEVYWQPDNMDKQSLG